MANLNTLQKEVVQFRDARDWKQFHTYKDMLLSQNLEVSELCEHFQWKSAREIQEMDKKKVGEELSDILYWILLLSNDLEVDIEDAFRKKMKKNAAKYPLDQATGSKDKYTSLKA